MHLQLVARFYTNQHVTERERTNTVITDLDINDISVFDPEIACVGWRHVDVTPGADHTLFDGHPASLGTDQRESGAVFNVTRSPNGGIDSQVELIGP